MLPWVMLRWLMPPWLMPPWLMLPWVMLAGNRDDQEPRIAASSDELAQVGR
jgi:hypothetical protein